jgi:hypothetical protein
MARKTTAPAIGDRSKRQRAPLQMALFREAGVEASDGGPAWPDLPEDARNVLVGLLTQLMLEHVRASVATEASHDC